MLAASASRIVAALSDDAVVLDVGGWASPFRRADWVLDLLPYATRGLYGYEGPDEAERFSADTWVQRDICDHEPWPFGDGQFDFAVCAHTLEDVRDPIWVCEELQRVARAGYIECPSRVEEQTWGVQGEWVGWSHHRWLVDLAGDQLRFVNKPAVLHERDHLARGDLAGLSETDRVVMLWWEGGFDCAEQIFIEPEQLHAYLREVAGNGRTLMDRRPTARRAAWRPLRRLRRRVVGTR